jgi:hypothetical protein
VVTGIRNEAAGSKTRKKVATENTKVTDQEMAQINIIRDEFHGEWNYTTQGNRVNGQLGNVGANILHR